MTRILSVFLLSSFLLLTTALAAANKPLLSSPSTPPTSNCPTCSPSSSTNKCVPGTSCISTGPSSQHCACAAGYKASVANDNKQHFKLNLTGVYTPWNYTVFVAPGVSCGVPCEDWSAWTVGGELCAEVGLLMEEGEVGHLEDV